MNMLRKQPNENENIRLLRLTQHFKSKDKVSILIRKLKYAEKYKNYCSVYEILDISMKLKVEIPKSKAQFMVEYEHINNIIICKN